MASARHISCGTHDSSRRFVLRSPSRHVQFWTHQQPNDRRSSSNIVWMVKFALTACSAGHGQGCAMKPEACQGIVLLAAAAASWITFAKSSSTGVAYAAECKVVSPGKHAQHSLHAGCRYNRCSREEPRHAAVGAAALLCLKHVAACSTWQ